MTKKQGILIFHLCFLLQHSLIAGGVVSLFNTQTIFRELEAACELGGEAGSARIEQLLFEKIYAGLSSDELYALINQRISIEQDTLFDHAFKKSDTHVLATLMSFLADPRMSNAVKASWRYQLPLAHKQQIFQNNDIDAMFHAFIRSAGSPESSSAIVLNFILNVKKLSDTTKYPFIQKFRGFEHFDILDEHVFDVLRWHREDKEINRFKYNLRYLHGLVRSGDNDAIKNLIPAGYALEPLINGDNPTPLEIAWAFGEQEMVAYLSQFSSRPRLLFVLQYFDGKDKTAKSIVRGIENNIFVMPQSEELSPYIETGKLNHSILHTINRVFSYVPYSYWIPLFLRNPEANECYLISNFDLELIWKESLIDKAIINQIAACNKKPGPFLRFLRKKFFDDRDSPIDIATLNSLALNPHAGADDFIDLLSLGIVHNSGEPQDSPLQIITEKPWCSFQVLKVLVDAQMSLGNPAAKNYAVANVIRHPKATETWLRLLLQHGGQIPASLEAHTPLFKLPSEKIRIEQLANRIAMASSLLKAIPSSLYNLLWNYIDKDDVSRAKSFVENYSDDLGLLVDYKYDHNHPSIYELLRKKIDSNEKYREVFELIKNYSINEPL